MPFCTTCGSNVNGVFCTQCGTPVGAAGASPPQPAQPPSMPPPTPYGAQTPGMAPPPYAPPYGAPPQGMAPMPTTRKTSPLVWVLVIVLGLCFLGFASCAGFGLYMAHKVKQAGIDPDLWRNNPGLAVGKILAATNPNIEVVRSDDRAGTVTIRDKRNGKETTMTFDQARNGKFSITADDDRGGTATMQFGGGANTNDLPSWVPKYPGSEGTSTFAVKGSGADGSDGGSFTFTTPDSSDKVLQFYRDKIQDLGLKVKMSSVTGDTSMIVATEDGDKRSLTVIIGSHPGSTSASITYGSKR
jgi:hypothetical protein